MNEFASANYTAGQLNAMVKLLAIGFSLADSQTLVLFETGTL